MSGPSWYSGVMNVARNEDWRVLLQYQLDLTVSGDPVTIVSLDLTGSTLQLQIRKTQADSTALVTISIGDGITMDNARDGLFSLTIVRAKLRRLQAGEYVADLVRTDPNGYAERMWEGTCIVVDGVTR